MLDLQTSTFATIKKYIEVLREKKGSEEKALKEIKAAQNLGHDFVINLLWEEALIYQHLVMAEDVKNDQGDTDKRNKNLLKFEETVGLAKYYIVRFDLSRWKHRLYRFIGRVYDFKGRYLEAIKAYKKSIRFALLDPDYKKGIPRKLEVEGFLASSYILAGDLKKGLLLSREIYDRYDHDKGVQELKKKDIATWIIWKSGIPVRIILAILKSKSLFDKKELLDWLGEAEAEIKSISAKQPWTNLEYRTLEIESVRRKLASN